MIVHPGNGIPVAFTVPNQHYPYQQQQQIAYYMSSPSAVHERTIATAASAAPTVMSQDQVQNRHLFTGRIDDQYIQNVCVKLFTAAIEEEQRFKAQENRNANANDNNDSSEECRNDSKDESLKSSSSSSSLLDADSNSDPVAMEIEDNGAASQTTSSSSDTAELSRSGDNPTDITTASARQEHLISPPAADTLDPQSNHHDDAGRLEIALQEAVLTQFRDILQTLVTQTSKGKGAASEETTPPHTSVFHPGAK